MTTEKKAIFRNSVLAALFFAVFFGIFEALIFGIGYAIITAPIAGLLFGLAMYFFVNSKKINEQTNLSEAEQESIIYSGAANHFKNTEAVGGKLYLLTDRIEFKSHQYNFQKHSFSIGLHEIQALNFYKTLGLIPNGLEVILKDGEVEKFVVNNRNTWRANIEKQIQVNPILSH
ncbi:hypothetical protein ACFOG5_10045 [Pedobacter fastidiosus]|uniref:GRAM domain-containing protein n=1 Tax=Pedobacter fastidiosus TaxID=2765361 RepID=A0ABR7KWD6_9SPHI|nr:hypothetical protein [Pedobacter fastidiosus]MBC6112421.1 hypothetical protein [Pedobacter fastidiosus]